MEKLIPSPVTSIEEQATGQVPVSHVASVATSAVPQGAGRGEAGEHSA